VKLVEWESGSGYQYYKADHADPVFGLPTGYIIEGVRVKA
jgi:hypothetical protein